MNDKVREALKAKLHLTDDSNTINIDVAVEVFKNLDPWQPIETAPRDGTRIFCISSNRIIRVDYFDENLSTRQFANEYGNDRYTHWQPLPKPPEEK